jgi:hypothetical protein
MKRWLAALLLGLAALRCAAAPVALDDAQLASVDGRDGVVLAVHLELDSALLNGGVGSGTSLVAGFQVNGVTTYAVVSGLGGIVDLFSITLDVRNRTDGGAGSYLDIGLPGFVGFTQFGFRALAAQTDPQAPITAANSYGQVLLNGTATMTGHVYLWAQ